MFPTAAKNVEGQYEDLFNRVAQISSKDEKDLMLVHVSSAFNDQDAEAITNKYFILKAQYKSGAAATTEQLARKEALKDAILEVQNSNSLHASSSSFASSSYSLSSSAASSAPSGPAAPAFASVSIVGAVVQPPRFDATPTYADLGSYLDPETETTQYAAATTPIIRKPTAPPLDEKQPASLKSPDLFIEAFVDAKLDATRFDSDREAAFVNNFLNSTKRYTEDQSFEITANYMSKIETAFKKGSVDLSTRSNILRAEEAAETSKAHNAVGAPHAAAAAAAAAVAVAYGQGAATSEMGHHPKKPTQTSIIAKITSLLDTTIFELKTEEKVDSKVMLSFRRDLRQNTGHLTSKALKEDSPISQAQSQALQQVRNSFAELDYHDTFFGRDPIKLLAAGLISKIAGDQSYSFPEVIGLIDSIVKTTILNKEKSKTASFEEKLNKISTKACEQLSTIGLPIAAAMCQSIATTLDAQAKAISRPLPLAKPRPAMLGMSYGMVFPCVAGSPPPRPLPTSSAGAVAQLKPLQAASEPMGAAATPSPAASPDQSRHQQYSYTLFRPAPVAPLLPEDETALKQVTLPGAPGETSFEMHEFSHK